jgi:hypothetical protein
MSSQGSYLSSVRRLKLETLECRTNPSRVLQEGDTLIIIGTQEDDTVAIVDDGQGGLEVTFDNTANGGGKGDGSGGSGSGRGSKGSGSGSRGSHGSDSGSSGSDSCESNGDDDDGDNGETVTRSFTGVEEVIFIGLRGNDTFSYDLTGPLTSDLDLDLLLGGGANQATINAADGIDADARLRVDLKSNGGDDDVAVDLGEVGEDAQFELEARLGGGADMFDLIQVGNIGAGALVETRVQSGGGDDTVSASFEGDVAEDAELAIRLQGGGGDDDITALFTGGLAGDLNLRANGGGGNDTVTGEIELVGESEGEIEARVRGNAGDDDLTLNILDPEELAILTTALIDGGDGTDTATNTDNVDVENVP